MLRNLEVSIAFSGKEAMQVLEANKNIEVVILDVRMPEMDGIQTLAEIKKNFPLVEVIMLSGHATVESAIDGMKQGAYDYLIKPCDMELLMGRVSEAAAKNGSMKKKLSPALRKSRPGVSE